MRPKEQQYCVAHITQCAFLSGRSGVEPAVRCTWDLALYALAHFTTQPHYTATAALHRINTNVHLQSIHQLLTTVLTVTTGQAHFYLIHTPLFFSPVTDYTT